MSDADGPGLSATRGPRSKDIHELIEALEVRIFLSGVHEAQLLNAIDSALLPTTPNGLVAFNSDLTGSAALGTNGGSGEASIELGDGNNIINEGTGQATIQLGNGNNLVTANPTVFNSGLASNGSAVESGMPAAPQGTQAAFVTGNSGSPRWSEHRLYRRE